MNYQRGQGYQQPRHTMGAGNFGRTETGLGGYSPYYPGSPTYGQQTQNFGFAPSGNTSYRPASTRMVIESEGRFQPVGTTNASLQAGYPSSHTRQTGLPQYNYNYPSSRPFEPQANMNQRASQFAYPTSNSSNTEFNLYGPRYSEPRSDGAFREPQQLAFFGQSRESEINRRGFDEPSNLMQRAQSPYQMMRTQREQLPQQNIAARPSTNLVAVRQGNNPSQLGGRGSGAFGVATLTYTDQFGNLHRETRELGPDTFGSGQRGGGRGGALDMIPNIENELTALIGAMFGGDFAGLLGGGGFLGGGMLGGMGGFGPRDPFAMISEDIFLPRMLRMLMVQELQRENQPRGLAPEELNRIPISQFKASESRSNNYMMQSSNNPAATSDKACTICLTDFQQSELLRTMKCTHKFHKTCIDQWLVRNGTCPICRESAT